MRRILSWIIIISAYFSLFVCPAGASRFPILRSPIIEGERSTTLFFDAANDLIVINATINGKGPFRFLLDSGASHHVMTPKLAESLELKVEGSGIIDAGGKTKVSAGLVRVAEVQLGEFKLAKQNFLVTPFPASYPFQGFLGAELFKHFIVHIDFQRTLLTLTAPNNSRYRGHGAVFPIKFHEGLIPQLQAEVDGNAGWFKLDTGYNGSLALFRKFIDEHELLTKYSPQKSDTGSRTLTNEVSNIPSAHVHEFKLGDLTLHNMLASFFLERDSSNNAIFAGAIGIGVLKEFNVIIDYPGRRVILESR